jgi:hypothetical protein
MFLQALQQNAHLLQKLQHISAARSSTSSTPQPHTCYDLQQQTPTWHMMQVAMLRKALTVANMRLTAAGMMPVAATSDLLQDEVRGMTVHHSKVTLQSRTADAAGAQ